MESDAPTIELVAGTPGYADFVRDLSAVAFGRFGCYDATLPPQLGLPWIRCFVALADGEPAGFVMCSLEDAAVGEIDLIAIAVAEPWQSRGIGRRLLERAEEETRRLVAEKPAILRLTVSEDNLRAREVFARFGFASVAGEGGRYPRGQVSLEMRKPIDSIKRGQV